MSQRAYVIFFTLLLSVSWIACKPEETKKASFSPCDQYETSLDGVFQSPYLDGSFRFDGGLAGNVEIAGVDFNDITCTYSVTDCTSGATDMNCQGQAYQEVIKIFSPDSIQIGATVYLRVAG